MPTSLPAIRPRSTPCSTTLPPVVRAFDRVAEQYDEICDGDLLSGMRRRVHGRLTALFGEGARVLEVGCGTGRDAAFLASLGVHVVAADPSAGMLERARARVREARQPVHLICCGLQDLHEHLPQTPAPPAWFDGILSNFGALNCQPRLEALGQLAVSHLAPGGRLLLGLMTPLCAWETGYFVLRGQPRTGWRRRASAPVPVQVGGIDVPTYYHRPRDVMAALGSGFRLERVIGLGVVVPPPYLESPWQRLPPIVRRAMWAMDAAAARWRPFNRLGDHIWLEVVRE